MNQTWRCFLVCALLLLLFLCACDGSLNLPDGMDEPTHPLTVAQSGERPSASDFLSGGMRAWCGSEDIAVSFVQTPDFDTLGEHTVSLVLQDVRGRAAQLSAVMTVVEDSRAPTLSGVRDRSCLTGEGVALREGVAVTDDCFGAVTWHVDTSSLDTSRAGFYSVTYVATDASGNEARAFAHVTVYDAPLDEAALWASCDAVLSDILPENATAEQICRAVHTYVQSALEYFPVSDKSDWKRAAQVALFEAGQGDCFSYFSAAKALLGRAGVRTLDVERIHAAGEETHVWLMVDLGGEGASRWYHFDPTELDASYGAHDGCLFTDAQLAAYNAVRPGFYDYDRAAYPASAQDVLTEGGQ